MPRMASKVFAALLATDSGKLTAADLGEQLQVSPAAVSGAVRYLIQVGMVARRRESGSRRDHYVLHSDFWYELMVSDMTSMRGWSEAFEYGVHALGQDTPAGARILDSMEFFEFLQREWPALMEKWRNRRTQPG